MGKINWSRVLLGGLLAGLILNVIDFVVNMYFLQERWAAAMKAIGKSPTLDSLQIAGFIVLDFVVGILTVWLYSAIRPRYGAGPRTAACAGSAVWGLLLLLPSVGPAVLHIFPRQLLAIGVAVGLVEMILAALAGAWLYKEEESG